MIDLQELVQNNQPIYVMNQTGQFLEKPSTYVLEIKANNKRAFTVPIPATKFPFLLSAHVPPILLKDSTEFYEALTKGILRLISPDEAKKRLADPMAQQVVDAAMRRFQPTKRQTRKPPELKMANTPGVTESRVPPGANVGLSAGESTVEPGPNLDLKLASTGDVNPSVIQICMDLASDKGLRDEKLMQLAGMPNLTEKDLGYVVSNCKEHAKVVQWARSELANLSGLNDDYEDDGEEEPMQPQRGKRKKRNR